MTPDCRQISQEELDTIIAERDQLRADLVRAKEAPAVPEYPTEEQLRRAGYIRPGTREYMHFCVGWRCCAAFASRLRAHSPANDGVAA